MQLFTVNSGLENAAKMSFPFIEFCNAAAYVLTRTTCGFCTTVDLRETLRETIYSANLNARKYVPRIHTVNTRPIN